MAVRTTTDEALYDKPLTRKINYAATDKERGWGWALRALMVAFFFAGSLAVLAAGEPLASIECDPAPGIAEVRIPEYAVIEIEIAANAQAALGLLERCEATIDEMNDALLGDFAYIAIYGMWFAATVWWFAPRGYRMEGLRRIRRSVLMLVAAAVVLDLLENLMLAIGFNNDGHPEVAFVVAAASAWGKFVCLAAVVLYLLGAVAGFLSNPLWLQRAMQEKSLAEESDDDPTGGAQLAVSGGGVRSASFALGGLQAANDSPFRFDETTRAAAVSGGAYMVGAWSIGRLGPDRTPFAWRRRGTGRDDAGISPEEVHLRKNLNYLLKADPDNRPDAIPTILLGVAVNTVILGAVLVLASLPFGWLMRWIDPSLAEPFGPDRTWTMPDRGKVVGVWTGAALVLTVTWVLSARLLRGRRLLGFIPIHPLHTKLRPVAYGAIAMAIITAVVLIAIPFAMVEFPARVLSPGSDEATNPGLAAALLSVLSGLGISAAIRKVLKDELSARMINLGGYLLLLFGLIVGGWIATQAAITGPTDEIVRWWSLGAGVFALLYWGANPDWWSFAPFYRGRLRTAYALWRQSDGTATDLSSRSEPLLGDPAFQGHNLQPEICGAVQVRDSTVATHAGIPALSLTMSAEKIRVHLPRLAGGDATEFSCTPNQMQAAFWASENPRMTTMWAVGISGAAVNPSMGRLSKGSTRALLAFANVRLGVWIPNPRWARLIDTDGVEGEVDLETGAWNPTDLPKVSYPRVRLTYLFKEMFGLHDLKDAYVHAADGGHWENTAISQLLRVEPGDDTLQEVLALDSSGGNPASANGLAEAISLVSLEHGREIDIDIEPTRAKGDETRGGGVAEQRFAVGVIRNDGRLTGLLWYTRPVVTAASSAQTLAFAERDPNFPGDSTANQLFEIEQFEAYRRLGDENVETLLEARRDLIAALRRNASWQDFNAEGEREKVPYVLDSVLGRGLCQCDFIDLKHHFAPDQTPEVSSNCLRHPRAEATAI